ncbi:MAG: hypothetical protein AAF629_34575 [Chloroflexota bacterium]
MSQRRLVKLPGLIALILVSVWGLAPSPTVFDTLFFSPKTLDAQTIQMALPPGCKTKDQATDITMPIPSQATLISNNAGIVAYHTEATIPQLVSFQEEQFPQYGWSVAMPPLVLQGQTQMRYMKEDQNAMVTISPVDDVHTKLTLIISQPDSSL